MNILTFDIEDWWVYDYDKMGNKKDYLPRLNKYLNDILDILDEKNFKATFFCLGIIAREYPEVIKLIDNRGHQIACHSDVHTFMKGKDATFFYQDTQKALNSIEQVIGKKVIAYRAPAFSITETNIWAFEILCELGIEYDCSIYPSNKPYGGFISFRSNNPALIQCKNTTLKEFPIPLTSLFGKRFAYSGGGYFRFLPYSIIKKIMEKNDYVMTYFHIKDFDYKRKKVLSKRFHTYIGVKNAYPKFLCLLDHFNFINLEQAADMIDWSRVPLYKF